jgi:hypothetical protein
MAVVESLSVNLALFTDPFVKGAQKALKHLKGLDDQAKSANRTFKAFNATLKGANAIGGRIGLGGVFGGALGGFTFAKFATDSLKEHAKDNKELSATLADLNEQYIQIQKNFGAWLVQVADANGMLGKLLSFYRELSGANIDLGQAAVNQGNQPLGRLDTAQNATQLRKNIHQALAAKQAVLRQLNDSRGWSLSWDKGLEFDAPDEVLKRQFDTITAEIAVMQRRLNEKVRQGLGGTSLGFGDFFGSFKGLADDLEPFRLNALDTFNALSKGAKDAFGDLTALGKGFMDLSDQMKAIAERDAAAIIDAARSPL